VKHIITVSKKGPHSAAAWQDFLCFVVSIVSDILGATGGNLPLLSLLDDKCTPEAPTT